MGLFDRFKHDNVSTIRENSINDFPFKDHSVIRGLSLFNERGDWADPYIWSIIQYIFNGLRNVQYTFPQDNKLTTFLDNNLLNLVWLYWNYGYIVVDVDKKGNYNIPDYSKIRKDSNGRVVGYKCVYYSDKYLFEGKTDIQIVRKLLKEISNYKDAIQNLTNNYGAIGILSGGNLPVNPQEKQDFIDNLKSRYGIGSDKNNILVTTMPLNFSVMQFPVSQLELDEKVKEAYTLLCNYFQVPVDLIFGQATYQNATQAIKNFYSNCISPLAEIVLKVGRYCVKIQTELIPSEKLSFRIDNVPEIIESVRNVDNEYVKQLLENIKQMDELAIDSTNLKTELKTYLSSL